MLVLHCRFLHPGAPEVEKECARPYTYRCVHSKSVLLIPLSFFPSIYSSIHPVLYLFYTLLPNANRFFCSPLNSGSNTRPRMCRFVRERERVIEPKSLSVTRELPSSLSAVNHPAPETNTLLQTLRVTERERMNDG